MLAAILAVDTAGHRAGLRRTAWLEASSSFEQDVMYRRWAAKQGGVYVPITEETPPNPYLRHLPERDVTTPSGRKLTLFNPAYMTRQVHEMGRERYGRRGHITSLTPLRPANAPDFWEREALGTLHLGAEEVSAIENLNGVPYFRLMRPLITEEGCLQCHAGQGYAVGDVRGGISVSVPMSPLQAAWKEHRTTSGLVYGVIWLAGLIGIGGSTAIIGARARERDLAEQELRKNTILLDAVGEMAKVGGWEFDVASRRVDWTRELYRINHVPTDRALSPEDAAGFCHPDDQPRLRNAVRQALHRGESSDLELRLTGSSARERWARVTCIPQVEDGRVVKVSGMLQDITETKAAEAALQREAALRDVLLDNLPCVAMILKKGTREIVASNKAAREKGAVPGKTCYGFSADRDVPCPFCQAPELWETGVPQRLEVEYEGMYYEGLWVPLTDDLYVHYVFDISERKRAEAELIRHRDHLEELVRERTAKIEGQRREVEEANRLKSEFLANMSHELRTPLNSVMGLSRLMLARGIGKKPRQDREYLEAIERNGQQLLNLINDILDLSRGEAGQMRLTLALFSVSEVVDGVIAATESLFAEKDLRCRVRMGIMPRMHSDPGRVGQILSNLLSNAAKFT